MTALRIGVAVALSSIKSGLRLILRACIQPQTLKPYQALNVRGAVTTPSAKADGFLHNACVCYVTVQRPRPGRDSKSRVFLYFTVQVLRETLCLSTSHTCIRKSRTRLKTPDSD